MDIRLLAPEERFDANVISSIAFHMRMEDPEKERERSLRETVEDWGAFDDDGRLMARVINHDFTGFVNGRPVRNGGIGAVCTLPEDRESGAIRRIFEKLLPAARAKGEVISTLYPFNHAFYRKFGYETVCQRDDYTFPTSVLRDYRFRGRAVQWKPGDSIAPYLALGQRFASAFSLALLPTEERLRKAHFRGEFYRDKKFAYLLYGETGEAVAWLIFQDVTLGEYNHRIKVEDLAWLGREGFLALLGFLGRFTADYGSVCLPLPVGMELHHLIHTPQAYDVEKATRNNYMIRVVNVPALLGTLDVPAPFVLRVADDLLPENAGTWAVSPAGVSPAEGEKPDLSLDVRTLGQLAAGVIDLREAAYREDVDVRGREAVLEQVFRRRPVFVLDHF